MVGSKGASPANHAQGGLHKFDDYADYHRDDGCASVCREQIERDAHQGRHDKNNVQNVAQFVELVGFTIPLLAVMRAHGCRLLRLFGSLSVMLLFFCHVRLRLGMNY